MRPLPALKDTDLVSRSARATRSTKNPVLGMHLPRNELLWAHDDESGSARPLADEVFDVVEVIRLQWPLVLDGTLPRRVNHLVLREAIEDIFNESSRRVAALVDVPVHWILPPFANLASHGSHDRGLGNALFHDAMARREVGLEGGDDLGDHGSLSFLDGFARSARATRRNPLRRRAGRLARYPVDRK